MNTTAGGKIEVIFRIAPDGSMPGVLPHLRSMHVLSCCSQEGTIARMLSRALLSTPARRVPSRTASTTAGGRLEKLWPLERFPTVVNRQGFSLDVVSDSESVLVKEAGMDGAFDGLAFPRSFGG